MSTLQKLAAGLYLAVKDIPACSPIKCLTKTITSKRVVRPANRREMDVSWVLTARSVRVNNTMLGNSCQLAEKPSHSSNEANYSPWTGATNVFVFASASENRHVYVCSPSHFHILSL